MAQLLKGYLADASEKFLLELLDTAGKFSHLDAIEKINLCHHEVCKNHAEM